MVPKTPQSMMRTALAVILLIGFGVLEQRWSGGFTPSRPAPEKASDSTDEAAPGDASATPSKSGEDRPQASRNMPGHLQVAAGNFDFYVLSLSWSPTHCAGDEGFGRGNDMQCRSGRSYGFVLHGLWPQNERGWPESCPSNEPVRVTGRVLEQALKLSPSEKLVQHEWEKHGTCSGLSQADYYAAAALAVGSVQVPKAFRQPQQEIDTTANRVRQAFLDVNSGISEAGILVTCRRNDIGEVRVCLDKELQPRACSPETLKVHCGGRDARMLAVRGSWPRK